MDDSTKQLRMPFNVRGAFRDNLRDGRFSVCLECRPPTADQPFKLAMLPAVEIARFVNDESRVAAVMVIGSGDRQRHPLHRVIDHLHAACNKEMIAMISGVGKDPGAVRDALAALISNEVGTVVFHTGQALADHPRDKKGRPVAAPARYIGSCPMLRLAKRAYPDLCAGAQVNPFKYVLPDSYLQYYKLLKKLHTGADFICTAPGWDMAKYQELQWFMRSREVAEPVVARLRIVKAAEVTGILDHAQPGLVMSREFAALLQRESAVNDVQALAAQIRRTALQAAGCRLFGYSGVTVGGVEDAATGEAVVNAITGALDEFPDYRSWRAAWTEFHTRVEMAPYPQRYYVFNGLMGRETAEYDARAVEPNRKRLPPPGRLDLWRQRLGEYLRLAHRRGWFWRGLTRLICGSPGGHHWRLDRTFYLCAAACPKALEDGACGGSRENGLCEFGHRPCFYHRILSVANHCNRLQRLETADDD